MTITILSVAAALVLTALFLMIQHLRLTSPQKRERVL